MEPKGMCPLEMPVLDEASRRRELLDREFPEALRDGRLDPGVLGALAGLPLEEEMEKFGLNWHGKRQARHLSLTPSSGTLRPLADEPASWDSGSRNLLIEGDNLEVLKLLQKSYASAIKLIYIDPPYNTGGDFVYEDDFRDNIRNYLIQTGQMEDGARTTSEAEKGGRLHTRWLNMMYPRLRLARNLLREDGLIFVSIDDAEVAHLRLMLDEIFGEENFEGHIHWRRRHNQPNDPTKMLGLVAEHLVVYARDKAAHKAAGVGKIPLTGTFSNPDQDPRGDWASKPWKVGSDQSGSRYTITTPTGRVLTDEWMGEEATFKSLLADGRILFPDGGNGSPRKKYYRSEREQEGQCATNWWSHEQFGHNQGANALMTELFGEKNVFSNPKPIELITGILDVGNLRSGDIILDFFAGSGTTGHAVLAKNATDHGDRRYILVQLPESLDPNKADQAVPARFCLQHGLPCSISRITQERMRRAAKLVRQAHPGFKGDTGFKAFRLDTSNIRPWEAKAEDLPQRLLDAVEHVKEDRNEMDLLYELLLKLGLDLAVPIEQKTIAGKRVHAIGAGVLMVCLAEAITQGDCEDLANGILAWHRELAPAGETTLVFLDSAFADDVVKTNLASILGQGGLATVRSL